MNILWTTLAIALVIASVAAHELSHALAMRRRGVIVTSAGAGLPLAPMLRIRRKRPTASGKPFVFTISPWLIGAYVQSDEKDAPKLEALAYRPYSWVMGSGIVVNIVIGLSLAAMAAALSDNVIKAGVLLAIGFAFWFFGDLVTAYLVPILGIGILIFTVYTLMTVTGQPGGVVGIGQLLVSHSLAEALRMAGTVSVAIGLANMLPVFPFDGGRIFGRAMSALGVPSKAVTVFEAVGMVVAVGLLGYSIVTDVLFA